VTLSFDRAGSLVEASDSFADAMPRLYLAASGGDISIKHLFFWHLASWVLVLSRTRWEPSKVVMV